MLLGAWLAYLPQSVKLGALWDAELARLVLADEIVVHGFPIDQGQRICTLLLPGPQPEGGGRVSPHSNGGPPVPQFPLLTHMLWAPDPEPHEAAADTGKATGECH